MKENSASHYDNKDALPGSPSYGTTNALAATSDGNLYFYGV